MLEYAAELPYILFAAATIVEVCNICKRGNKAGTPHRYAHNFVRANKEESAKASFAATLSTKNDAE